MEVNIKGIILVTHGELGKMLLEVSRHIVGPQRTCAAVSLAAHEGLSTVREGILAASREMPEADGFLILVDMAGGTPSNAALSLIGQIPCEVVSGVNLYMLISAFTNRERLALSALAEKVAQDGRRSINNLKELFEAKLKR